MERQTSSTSISTTSPLVPQSRSPSASTAISQTMAFEGPGLPSPMPSTVLQDGLYQTFSSSRSTLQPQANHPGLVVGQTGQMPLSPDLAVIAEGSLLNKVFHSKKDYFTQLKMGLEQWARHNGLPTILRQEITDFGLQLWQQHAQEITCHITKTSISNLQSQFEGAIFHCEDKQASSLRVLVFTLKLWKKPLRIHPYLKLSMTNLHRLKLLSLPN